MKRICDTSDGIIALDITVLINIDGRRRYLSDRFTGAMTDAGYGNDAEACYGCCVWMGNEEERWETVEFGGMRINNNNNNNIAPGPLIIRIPC